MALSLLPFAPPVELTFPLFDKLIHTLSYTLLAFIAVRQKIAPWEGYRLERSSINFMLIFIFGMAALSLAAFVASLYNYKFIGTPVANAAHLSGLFAGWVLAYTSFFQWKG